MKILPRLLLAVATLPVYLQRHRMILNDPQRPTAKNQVNLHYWYPGHGARQNLGEYLSNVVVDYAKTYHGIATSPRRTRHLYAVGSIITVGIQNTTIWGSGLLEDPTQMGNYIRILHSNWLRKLDIRAVRGPHTRAAMLKLGHHCPEIYGDPAILMPRIYTPISQRGTESYCLIRHARDTQSTPGDLSIRTSDYGSFIERLWTSQRVISSSLHGIILAESYGIPAVLYLPEHMRQILTLYKYEDYYLGTGRTTFPVASTLEEALSVTPAPIPDLESQRDQLLATFPVDLWE